MHICCADHSRFICASIAGNISNRIQVNTDILYPTRSLRIEDTYIGYTISSGSLATALIVSVVVFTTVIVVTLTRIKVELIGRAERSTHIESINEDATIPIPSDTCSTINT